MDEAVFLQILNNLLEKARKKKNELDYSDINDAFKGFEFDEDKMEDVYEFLEAKNIDIINIIIDTLQEMLPADDPRRALVSKDLITYVEDRKGHDRRYAIAPDKIKAEIGWYPETMFKDGIRLTIQWFFEHEDWMKNVTSGDYQKYYEDMYSNK